MRKWATSCQIASVTPALCKVLDATRYLNMHFQPCLSSQCFKTSALGVVRQISCFQVIAYRISMYVAKSFHSDTFNMNQPCAASQCSLSVRIYCGLRRMEVFSSSAFRGWWLLFLRSLFVACALCGFVSNLLIFQREVSNLRCGF